jgi:hypothetical protein
MRNPKYLVWKQKSSFFNFFDKKTTYVDPKQRSIRKSDMSTYIIGGMIGISWIFIFKMWFGAEETARLKFEEYNRNKKAEMAENGSQRKSQPLPEEFRAEYVSLNRGFIEKILCI